MLSDSQIDELENLIYFSEPDETMEVLSKVIPVLFAELRITRGTLNSKVDSFLNGVTNAGNSINQNTNDAPEDEASTSLGAELVPQQSHEHSEDNQGSEPQPELPASPSDSSAADKREKKPRRVSRTSRNKAKKAGDSGRMDTGAVKPKVDRNTGSKSKAASRKRSKQDSGIDDLPNLTGDD